MRVDKPTLALLHWIVGLLFIGTMIQGEKGLQAQAQEIMELQDTETVRSDNFDITFDGSGIDQDGNKKYSWEFTATVTMKGSGTSFSSGNIEVSHTRTYTDGVTPDATVEWNLEITADNWYPGSETGIITMEIGEQVLKTSIPWKGDWADYAIVEPGINVDNESSRSSESDNTWATGESSWTVRWNYSNQEPDIRIELVPPGKNPCQVGETTDYQCKVDGKVRYGYIYEWYVDDEENKVELTSPLFSQTWGEPGQHTVGCIVTIEGEEYDAPELEQGVDLSSSKGKITLSSSEANNSPQEWKMGASSTGYRIKSLIIPFNKVAIKLPPPPLYHDQLDGGPPGSYPRWIIENYHIDLSAELSPELPLPSSGVDLWSKVSGPASGELQNADQFDAKYFKPAVGGVYTLQFVHPDDLGTSVNGYIWLPKAGPEVGPIWDSEFNYLRFAWGPHYRSLGKTMREAIKDLRAYGNYLDYGNHVNVNASSNVDDLLPQRFPTQYSANDGLTLTYYGVPLDPYTIHNMIYAFVGREMGIPEAILYYAPRIADIIGGEYPWIATYVFGGPVAGIPDDADTLQAYKAGFAVSNGMSFKDAIIKYGWSMQDTGTNVPYTWPATELYNGTFIRPQLITNFAPIYE